MDNTLFDKIASNTSLFEAEEGLDAASRVKSLDNKIIDYIEAQAYDVAMGKQEKSKAAEAIKNFITNVLHFPDNDTFKKYFARFKQELKDYCFEATYADEDDMLNEGDGLDLKFDDESEEKHEKKHEHSEEPHEEKSPRQQVREAIKDQVEVANSVISSIGTAFDNDCEDTKKFGDMVTQIKNFEKQIRGACQQVVSVVEAKGFDALDKTKCSPVAYKTITNYDSRDLDCVKLSSAIIVFYNSLA